MTLEQHRRASPRATAASSILAIIILLAFLASVVLMFRSSPELTPIEVIRTTPVPTVPATPPSKQP